MNNRAVLAGLALIVSVPFALAQERAAKPKTVQPVQIEKAPATQPAQLEKKPARAGKQPYIERLQFTPDINQNMTIQDYLDQLPAAEAKKQAPEGLSLKTKMFKKNMCAPASVANHLLWLDRTAFKNISNEAHPIIAGVDLIHILSRKEYMKTATGGSGTSLANVVSGTYRFLKEKGIPVKKVTVISISAHPDYVDRYKVPSNRLRVENRIPKVQETRNALRKRTIVLNLFGKYKLFPGKDDIQVGKQQEVYLQRTGGHYIAPVGYGRVVNKVYDGDVIIYHNPADKPQNQQKQQYVKWLKETGANAKLRMIKLEKPGDHEVFRTCKQNKNWTCYGLLGDSYVRDKALDDHKPGEIVRILEALVVIEV